jgi:hypothetical protein
VVDGIGRDVADLPAALLDIGQRRIERVREQQVLVMAVRDTRERATISFSGSFHLVVGVVASHSSLSPNPLPPMNFSFICGGTGFSRMVRSPTFT